MVGAGGVLIEFLRDQALALAPFDTDEALRLIDSLALRPLLDGKRGRPPADVAALAEALARFSVMTPILRISWRRSTSIPCLLGPKASAGARCAGGGW